MTWAKFKSGLFEYRVGLQYTLFARRNHFTATSKYMNMGYWEGAPRTLDDACKAMARLVGEACRIEPGDRVLDLGFGFADQDIYWLERYSPRQIVGLDVAAFQVRAAKRRVAERGLAHRIKLSLGSATDIRFPDGAFDKVVSLESAFHFATRENFFAEAYRVLRPGGRLVLTDMIPEAAGGHWLSRVSPAANLYPRDVYARKLGEAGFKSVEVLSIREHVCAPYREHVALLLKDPAVTRHINPLSRRMLVAAADPGLYEGLDYVLVSAEK